MSDVFYSPSRDGFFLPDIHANLFVEHLDEATEDRSFDPDPGGPIADAIRLSGDEHAALLDGQSAGKKIQVVDGHVSLVDYVADLPAAWRNLQRQAGVLLKSSDLVVIRCFERGVPVPVDWVAYREALREIIRADDGEALQPLPLQPDYPDL